LKGKKYRFAVAGGTLQRCLDPLNESERQAIYALQEGIDNLVDRHVPKLGQNYGILVTFKLKVI
jgi:homospermidine synthase